MTHLPTVPTLAVAWLLIGLSASGVPTARAQSVPLPTPGVQVATSPPGTVAMQGPGYAGWIPQPGPGTGSQYGPGRGPVRLPNQNCGGMGQCAWVSQSEGAWSGQLQATAACTPDARVCMSTGSAPMYPSMLCSVTGTLRTCSDQSVGGLGVSGGPTGIMNTAGALSATNPSAFGAMATSTPGPSSILPVR